MLGPPSSEVLPITAVMLQTSDDRRPPVGSALSKSHGSCTAAPPLLSPLRLAAFCIAALTSRNDSTSDSWLSDRFWYSRRRSPAGIEIADIDKHATSDRWKSGGVEGAKSRGQCAGTDRLKHFVHANIPVHQLHPPVSPRSCAY